MARTMNLEPDAPLYRAAITKKYRHTEEPFTSYEGPYTTAAAAQARVTYWKNLMDDRDLDIDGSPLNQSWATGEVEVGTVTWAKRS